MTKRMLLIDADVVAYQCASRLERITEWEPGFWTWNVCFDEVCHAVDDVVEMMQDKLDADAVKLCLTDPHHNFRLDILPTYKMNRSTLKRPLVLYHIKDWLVEERDALMRPGLEGDDLLGIMATYPSKGEKVIVSLDKDMKTVPGLYCRTKAVVAEDGAELIGAWDIQEITEEAADNFHLAQTLAGDVTDGYSGCPGVGMTTAEKIIEGKIAKVPYEHELKRGPRAGEVETRYSEEEAETAWDAVVSHFAAAGLGEEEALCQARVARILRASDYDFKRKKVIPWTPATR